MHGAAEEFVCAGLMDEPALISASGGVGVAPIDTRRGVACWATETQMRLSAGRLSSRPANRRRDGIARERRAGRPVEREQRPTPKNK